MKKARAQSASRKELEQTISELERKAELNRQTNVNLTLANEGKDQEIAQLHATVKKLEQAFSVIQEGYHSRAGIPLLVVEGQLSRNYQ